MADLKAFAEQLVNLSVKDVNELAKILKDEYGIEPAAAAAAAAAPAAAAAEAVEQTSFDVILKSASPNMHFRCEVLVAIVVAIQFRTALFLLADVNIDVARPANRKETQIASVVF